MHQPFDSEMNIGGITEYLKEMFDYPFDIHIETTNNDAFKVEIAPEKTTIFIEEKFSNDHAFKLITYFLIKESLYEYFEDTSEKVSYDALEPIIDAFYRQYSGIMYEAPTKRIKH